MNTNALQLLHSAEV